MKSDVSYIVIAWRDASMQCCCKSCMCLCIYLLTAHRRWSVMMLWDCLLYVIRGYSGTFFDIHYLQHLKWNWLSKFKSHSENLMLFSMYCMAYVELTVSVGLNYAVNRSKRPGVLDIDSIDILKTHLDWCVHLFNHRNFLKIISICNMENPPQLVVQWRSSKALALR